MKRNNSTNAEMRLRKVFLEFQKLKEISRKGWLNNGLNKADCESVADHSFGVCILTYFLIKELKLKLNLEKAMAMALLHEVGEVYAGDITPSDNISYKEKFKREKDSANRVLSGLLEEDYESIWREFEEGKTPEARFVKEIDKCEMVLQAQIYTSRKKRGANKIYANNISKIKSPFLIRMILKSSEKD